MSNKKSIQKRQGGQALIISVLMVGILLSIALTLAFIFLPKIRASSDITRLPLYMQPKAVWSGACMLLITLPLTLR